MLNFSDEGAQSQRRYCSVLPARGAQLERYIHDVILTASTISKYSINNSILRCGSSNGGVFIPIIPGDVGDSKEL